MHDWTFHAAGEADAVFAVAICTQCGEVRTVQASDHDPRQIDLTGDCSAAPPKPSNKVRMTSIGAQRRP